MPLTQARAEKLPGGPLVAFQKRLSIDRGRRERPEKR